MFTVTMIAKPGALAPEMVHSLRNAWGGGDAVWLAPDEAAEFPVRRVPNHWEDVWSSLQEQGADLCIQRTGHRRKQLLIADMDSTMIGQECIDELADAAGVGEKVSDITRRAMNGELDFEGALIERVALLEGLEAGVVDRVLEERITLTPGGKPLLATMKANGAHTVLVSGGFTAFAEPLGAELGFDEVQANRLIVEGGKLTGEAAPPILGREAKVEALERACRAKGISPREAMAVGDGANDLGMLELAGTGVALHAKPSVQAACKLRVNHGDLSALLYLQGYSKGDFLHPPEPEDYAV
ncbi:phosphoserine phosphatase SerB [Histidinibacterium aquaticum]|uniref:Phosphoserine phosphatase n=1 Tax=Histidinibacterium aquaticum TaxID=2613962 RepID=A0A5J5GGX3_9RHOB|nr:phosphoserine phosphatase SerB [Histidinibacterium aquaticum]KAA9006993.1 phosphoserine phosphatase SerB [Histidinibacterium aquaticum]